MLKCETLKRRAAKLLGGAVLATFLASTAQAGFVISSVRTTIGSEDVVVFRALNDGTGGSGTKLQALDVVASTPYTAGDNIKIQLADFDGDGENDANPIGVGINAGQATGSFIRIGSTANFNTVFVDPSPTTTDTDFDGIPDQAIAADYVNGKVVSFNVAGFPFPAPTATAGSGQVFANIVVPTGISVQVFWQMGGEIGNPFVGTYIDPGLDIPEPATLGVLALGALGLLARRRQA